MNKIDLDHLKCDQEITEIEHQLMFFYLKHRWKVKLLFLMPILSLLCSLSIIIISIFQLFINNNSQDEWYIYCIAIIFAILQYAVVNIRLSSIPYLAMMEYTMKALETNNIQGTERENIQLASFACTKLLIDDDEMSINMPLELGFFQLLLPFLFILFTILIILSHSVLIKSIILVSYLFPTLIFINMSKEIIHIGGLFAKVSVLNWASTTLENNKDK